MASGLTWSVSPATLGVNCKAYGDKVLQGMFALADQFVATIQSYAQQNAPWNDQTGAARQGLRAFAEKAAAAITIYLVHSVSYGIFLELGTRNMGPRAIIGPTLEAHYGQIMSAIRSLLASG